VSGKDVHWRADVPEDIAILAAELGLGGDQETDLDDDDGDFPEVYGMDEADEADEADGEEDYEDDEE
jgi:23S rRNA pseudouridine1911/1915/1917 synthase